LYSRTDELKEEFARAFFDADVAVVTGIYGAREAPVEGVTGELISELAAKYGHHNIQYIRSLKDVEDHLTNICKAGDRVVFMGAGDIWRTATAMADRNNESGK
jgi:UDP-N-acetylmuramate--alanine ligase